MIFSYKVLISDNISTIHKKMKIRDNVCNDE